MRDDKYAYISELLLDEVQKLTRNGHNWLKFLENTGTLYKYSFKDESEMNMRDFILTCVYCQPMIIKKGADKIVAQLKYMGNNLNQLTRKVNSGQIKDCSAELEKMYNYLEVLRKEWQ